MNYHIIESLQKIEDEWGLDISETSEDRIKFLKRECKFLDLFLSLQSFTDLSYMANVTHKVQHLFRHAALDLRLINEIYHVDRVTDQLQVKIQMTKLEIRSVYLFPKVNKDGIVDVTSKFVMDLIDTVVVNLGDLLKVYCSSSLLFVPEPKKEIGDVFKELKLLRNFVCFVSESQHTDFFTHVLEVVSYAAMISWLYLPSNGSENQEMNVLLSDLLQMKIKPIDPSTSKIYIDVLLALRSECHRIIQIDHIAGFVETLQHNLKTLPVSNLNTHQIAALQEMLNLLITNLSIQDLEFHLQDIDSVMIDSGLLVYSLCEDVVLGEVIIDLQGTIQRIKTVIYHIIRKEFQFSLPRIHGLGYVDFVLSNLKEFKDRYPDSLAFVKTELQMIQTELEDVQPFLRSVAEQQYNIHDEVQNSVALLIGKAYEVEYIVDACVSKKVPDWCLVFWLLDIITDIRAEVAEIQQKKMVEVDLVSPYTIATDTSRKSSEMAITSGINEKIVGFEDVIETLRDRLTQGPKRLDTISIVGMPGGGKTTLAKRLYFDKLVVSHFDIRAQCHVSPVYSLRGLLLSLLAMLHIDETSLHSNETDELKYIIYRSLRSRRYLILLDDVWDCRVWDDIRLCFPDDNNGSRILLTTRNHDVANNVISVSEPPLHLRLLTYEESWVLLKVKVFGNETCSPHFENVGQEIAKKCEGLPLSIVLVAGVLSRMEKTEDCWSQVAKDLGSYIAVDAKAILEPSYQHLPYHLKSCFLYFGTFLEDKEINVSKLTWLWIGEGFVKDLEVKSLQDIAKGYLENLHRRSLVMNAKRNSDGIVKACRIHDLLLDFCRRKAEEEHLLLWIKRDGNDKSSSGISSHKQLAQRRLVFYCEEENLVERSSSCSPVDSVLYREDKRIDVSGLQDSRMFYNFKFLKVLDLESIVIYSFPTVLVYLRFFAAQTAQDSITPLITNLWNLETLILKPTKGKLKLPVTIWKMVKLRHLCIDNAYFTLNGTEGLLDKLEVLSSTCFSCAKDVELLSGKTPNLRELRCSFGDFRQEFFPKLDFLTRLEMLEIHLAADSTVVGPYNFPASLRNLTLSNFFLGSCHESNISRLPNLCMLKLVSIFFDNDKWEVRDGEFLKLKVLKLVKCEFFEEWKVSYHAFPMLEHLVLRECLYLKAIPSSFQYISTLKSIKVKSCSESVERSATYIKQQQEDLFGYSVIEAFTQKEERDNLSVIGGRNADIQLLLGVLAAPLIPHPIQCNNHSVNKNINDHPNEASMAKYIVQQYIAAAGGEHALNSINSMYAMGKVKMMALMKIKSAKNGAGEMGGFVLWQKRPDLWSIELVVSGCKISAGSDGKVSWRQTPWHHSHTSRGPARPLRRSLQGLDPRSTADMFSDSICIGEKTMNSEDCFVLKFEAESSILKARSSSNVEIMRHTVWGYFSQRTGLLVQLEDTHLLRLKAPNDDVFWETTMESLVQDYRTINGVNIAHAGKTCVSLFRFGKNSEGHTKTRMEEVWTIEEVDFNIKGLSLDCFLPPSDLKKRR